MRRLPKSFGRESDGWASSHRAAVRSLQARIVDHPDKLVRPLTNPLWRQLDRMRMPPAPMQAFFAEPCPTLGPVAPRRIEQSQNFAGAAIWRSTPPRGIRSMRSLASAMPTV
jgi:hypothetical protein